MKVRRPLHDANFRSQMDRMPNWGIQGTQADQNSSIFSRLMIRPSFSGLQVVRPHSLARAAVDIKPIAGRRDLTAVSVAGSVHAAYFLDHDLGAVIVVTVMPGDCDRKR